MGAEDVVVVTVVSSETEAEMVCGLLRSAGIACGSNPAGAIGLPFSNGTVCCAVPSR